MSVNVGKGYNTTDIRIPTVTREMLIHAVNIVCGLAWNADDARMLLETLGITDEIVMEARSGNGNQFGLV